MGRILTLVTALLILNGCFIQDLGTNNSKDDLRISNDSISFDQFTMIELNKNDVFYNKDGNVSITFLDIIRNT